MVVKHLRRHLIKTKPKTPLLGLSRLTYSLVCALITLPAHAPAQDSFPPPPDTVLPTPLPIDEPFQLGKTPDAALSDTSTHAAVLGRESFFESPTGALLRSVAFPGWGQWSNGKRQKAAVYLGVESYFITKAVIWRHRARKANDAVTFEHARDRRNYFYWLTGITIFVSMFDAYADRYLLVLERTLEEEENFWGGVPQSNLPSSDAWQLSLAVRF